MKTRRAALLLGLALPGLALAQGTPRAAELDQLFAVLRDGQDAAQLALAEARIRQLWLEAASPAARLLMQRGTRNLNARLPEEAIEDFDAALTLAPNAASAWHLRAEALAVDAAGLMEQHRITSVLVVDGEQRLVGALNTNDLMRAKVI